MGGTEPPLPPTQARRRGGQGGATTSGREAGEEAGVGNGAPAPEPGVGGAVYMVSPKGGAGGGGGMLTLPETLSFTTGS